MLEEVKTIVKQANRRIPRSSPSDTVIDLYNNRYSARYGGQANYNLLGPRRFLTYRKMENDLDILASGDEAIKEGCSSVTWDFEPSEADKDKEMAQRFKQEFIENESYPWTQVIRQAVDYKKFGFNLLIWVFEGVPGDYRFKKVQQIPHHLIQQEWIIGQSRRNKGDVLGVVVNAKTTKVVPRRKFIYLVDYGPNGYYEGIGLYDKMAKPALATIALEELLTIALQISTVGFLKLKVPEMALAQAIKAGLISEEKAKERIETFEDFGRELYLGNNVPSILYPSDVYNALDEKGNKRPSAVPQWDIERVKADATGVSELENWVISKKYGVARTLGTQIQLLGEGSTGSLALSQVTIKAEEGRVDAINKYIQRTLQRDLINVYANLNGIPEELVPKLKVSSAKGITPEQKLSAFDTLARHSALPPEHPAINSILIDNELPIDERTPEEIKQARERAMEGMPEQNNQDPNNDGGNDGSS